MRRVKHPEQTASIAFCVAMLCCSYARADLANPVLTTIAQLPKSSPYVPTALNVGDTFQLIFATKMGYTGDLGGLAGADAIVQAAADSTGEIGGPVSWTALLSTSSVDAKDRVSISAAQGLYDTGGLKIANDQTDFWDGAVLAPVDHYEDRSLIPNGANWGETWSGTFRFGTKATYTCQDWSSAGSDLGRTGTATHSNYTWIEARDIPCYYGRKLYGVSEPITVTAAIPEASSVRMMVAALVGICLAGLSRPCRATDWRSRHGIAVQPPISAT